MPGVTKAAFIVGGEHGKGVMSCRAAGRWSAPVFMAFDKESFGAQIGAESIDLIVLVMNDRGVDRLLRIEFLPPPKWNTATGRGSRSATVGGLRTDFFANRFVSRALSRKS